MKNCLLILVLFVFGASTSFARTSERNFQASAGQSYFQGNLTYETGSFDLSALGLTFGVDTSDLLINAHFESGFSENLSGYVGIGYGSATFDFPGDESDFKGLSPLNLGLKFQKELSDARFFARLNAAYGLEKSDEDNRTSGVFALNLKLGYEAFIDDSSLFGASAAYSVVTTDVKSEDDEFGSTDDESTNGTAEISVYYEKSNQNGLMLGGHFDYEITTIFSGLDYTPEEFDFSVLEFGVYTRIELSENMFLLGNLDYLFAVSDPNAFLKDLSRFSIGTGLRVLF